MYEALIILLFLFLGIAGVDGLYFHIYRYRLYRRRDSQREHLLHTLNSALLPLCAAPLVLADARGAWLWTAVGLNVAAFVVESIDVVSEKTSRRHLGGLTREEYWMHFTMSGLRWMHLGLAFAIHPAAHWFGPSTWEWLPVSTSHPMTGLAWGAVAASVPVAVAHAALAIRGRAVLRAESGDANTFRTAGGDRPSMSRRSAARWGRSPHAAPKDVSGATEAP